MRNRMVTEGFQGKSEILRCISYGVFLFSSTILYIGSDTNRKFHTSAHHSVESPYFQHDGLTAEDLRTVSAEDNRAMAKLFGSHIFFGKQKTPEQQIEQVRAAAEHLSPQAVQERLSYISTAVESGLTTAQGKIPEATLEKMILVSFPQSWIIGEIKSITETDATHSSNPSLGTGGQAAASFDPSTDEIFYYKPQSGGESYSFIIGALAHEIAHANDWTSDNDMTFAERVYLVLALAHRIDSPDRWKSDYVESINNTDKQLERMHKITEYWAEICNQYFTNPQALYIADYILVHERVIKTDPNFDPIMRQAERKKIAKREFPAGTRAQRVATAFVDK